MPSIVGYMFSKDVMNFNPHRFWARDLWCLRKLIHQQGENVAHNILYIKNILFRPFDYGNGIGDPALV